MEEQKDIGNKAANNLGEKNSHCFLLSYFYYSVLVPVHL